MNKIDACIVLDISQDANIEEMQEKYELVLFEFKNQVLGKIWYSLQESKHKKAQQLDSVYRFLFDQPASSGMNCNPREFLAESRLDLWNQFQDQMNQLKLIWQRLEGGELANVLLQIKQLTVAYFQQLMDFKYERVEVKLSDQIDPMYIYSALVKAGREGLVSLEESEQDVLNRESSIAAAWLERLNDGN